MHVHVRVDMRVDTCVNVPTHGLRRVLLDGAPLDGMSNAELRARVAWVPQVRR